MGNPLDDIDAIEQIADPAERALEVGRRLEEIPKYQTRLREIRQKAVLEMRAKHLSFAQIGEKLGGLHRNRVQQIAEGRSGGGRGGAVSDLPVGVRAFRDGNPLRTWYEFHTAIPIDDTIQAILDSSGSHYHDNVNRVFGHDRAAILRAYEALREAGCRILGADEVSR